MITLGCHQPIVVGMNSPLTASHLFRTSVSAMLTRPGLLYSSFWADFDPENGYYAATDDYKALITYEQM